MCHLTIQYHYLVYQIPRSLFCHSFHLLFYELLIQKHKYPNNTLVENEELIKNNELAGAVEEDLTVDSLSEAAVNMGSMFVTGDVNSEE
jgi:hypothetical protein